MNYKITYIGNLPLKGDYASLLFHVFNLSRNKEQGDFQVDISRTFFTNLSEEEKINYGINAVECHLNKSIPIQGYRDSSLKIIYISSCWHPILSEDHIKMNSLGKFYKDVVIQKPRIGFKLD